MRSGFRALSGIVILLCKGLVSAGRFVCLFVVVVVVVVLVLVVVLLVFFRYM